MSATIATKTTRNALVLIVSSVFTRAILLLWQIGLTTALGPEVSGIYTTVQSLMAVSTAVVGFGLGIILIRDVAREPQKISQYWTSILFLQTVLGLLAYVMSVGAALLAGYSDIIVAYTAIGGLSLMIDIFGTMASDLLVAQERMTIKSVIEVGHIIIRVLSAAVFLRLGWGVMGVYIATLATGIIRSALFWAVHLTQGFHPSMPLDRALTWRLFWNAAPLAVASFFNLLYQHIDKLITTALLGEKSTGYIGPAFTISQGVIEVLNTTILISLFPYMSRQYVADEQGYGERVATLLRLMFVFSLPVAVTITLFAEPIVLLIFKAPFAPTIGVLRILIWFAFLTMIGNVLVQALQVQNRQRRVLWIRLVGLVINVIFTVAVLLAFRDPQGAALSAVVTQALVLGLLLLQFPEMISGRSEKRKSKPTLMGRLGQFPEFVSDIMPGIRYTVRISLMAVISGAVMLLFGRIHFIVGSFVGLLVYAALIWRGGLADTDRALVRQIIAVIPGTAWLRARIAGRL